MACLGLSIHGFSTVLYAYSRPRAYLNDMQNMDVKYQEHTMHGTTLRWSGGICIANTELNLGVPRFNTKAAESATFIQTL